MEINHPASDQGPRVPPWLWKPSYIHIYIYNSFHLFSIDVPKKSSINHRYPTYFLVGGGVASHYEPRPPVLTDRCLILGRNVSIADDAVRLPAEEDVVSTGTISVSGRTTLWLFNIAMGHGPFMEVYHGLPIRNGDFPWLCGYVK